MPKEGDEPIEEEAKQLMAKKLRYKIVTRGFFKEPKEKKEKKPKFKAV